MRHLQSLKLIRDVLIEVRGELVEAMMKDPASSIHYIDHTPGIFNKIDEALKECDSYSINKR